MILIVGLGNPNKQYEKTRHNAGWLFVDFFREESMADFSFGAWTENKKFNALVCEGGLGRRNNSEGGRGQQKIILAKPLTFMNESGRAIGLLNDFYKNATINLIVCHDDVDLPIGTFKAQKNISAAGHHGVESIINTIKTQDFWRIRIGIGKEEKAKQGDTSKFVLNKFSLFDRARLRKVFTLARESVFKIIENP
ncbi:aminoacyl-tRNA hydrolase [Candidatus Falkowbacteria bacterium]|nr:aminoacyl-tRNA hydrolase [Candidatus Falkowbacteria bacterium]